VVVYAARCGSGVFGVLAGVSTTAFDDGSPRSDMIRRSIDQYAGLACILILIGFGWAGLSPFDPSPNNGVSWVGSGGGLRLSRGSVLGPSAEIVDPMAGCSFEVWMRPGRGRRRSTVIEFFDERAANRLAIGQVDDRKLSLIQARPSSFVLKRIDHIARPEQSTLLITVTSDGSQTHVYVDGVLVRTLSDIQFLAADCANRFVLGTGAGSDNVWRGELLGMAIFFEDLTPSQILTHYEEWEAHAKDVSVGGPDPRASALYLFDDNSGSIVSDHSGMGRHLSIPPSFVLPKASFLGMLSWQEIRANGLDWPDVGINVSGFLPFGFFLAAFLNPRQRPTLAAVTAIFVGLTVSLAIETLQFWLPTRSSSLIDVVTNVLGTGIGVLVYQRLTATLALQAAGSHRP